MSGPFIELHRIKPVYGFNPWYFSVNEKLTIQPVCSQWPIGALVFELVAPPWNKFKLGPCILV